MRKLRLWTFVGIVAVLVVCNFAFHWSDALADGRAAGLLADARDAHPVAAALLYLALTVAGCAVLAVPGVVFALAAGAIFGAVEGTLLCWVSVTVGACASFMVARFFLKDSLAPLLAKNERLNALLFEGARKSDVYLLAITRLVPVFPYNLQNFAYGITDIGFAPYALYSALFMLPGTAVYTIAAAGVFDADNRIALFALALALLAAALAAAWVLRRKAGIA